MVVHDSAYWGTELSTLANPAIARAGMNTTNAPLSLPDNREEAEALINGATPVDAAFMAVYDKLKTMAHRELHRSNGNTLNTTSLVHELYMKMCLSKDLTFAESIKFFAYAAMAMRHILIDRATRRSRPKFGGDQQHIGLDDPHAENVALSPQLALQLDAALRALQDEDPRAARVVELHYFAGLPLDRVAELIGVVRRTAERDWRYARAFLEAHID